MSFGSLYFGKYMTDWNLRALEFVEGEINKWSRDPSTKVSAALFKGKYQLASAYNGFPPGIDDTDERLNDRPLKYKMTNHSEENLIATCAKFGIVTDGATVAITTYPCCTCAGLMISAGIKKIVTRKPTEDFLSRWKDDIELAMSMLIEAGVEIVVIN